MLSYLSSRTIRFYRASSWIPPKVPRPQLAVWAGQFMARMPSGLLRTVIVGPTALSSSSASYQDDDMYLNLPSGTHRAAPGLSADQTCLSASSSAPSDPTTAEFRDCTVAKHPQSCPAPSPGEDDGVMRDEAKKIMMALDRSPSAGDPGHLHLGNPGKNRPPMGSRQSTFSDSECALDGPALFHGYFLVMAQTPYVTFDDLPLRIRSILIHSANKPRPVKSAESQSSRRASRRCLSDLPSPSAW
ncbi:hypothetical protein F5I97DRAFT_1925070 [Phlebopus sp. FC_14]|nr:hypothetical protein F5I97DRAFT_1925070 [Phlebopus sp. FC_14]